MKSESGLTTCSEISVIPGRTVWGGSRGAITRTIAEFYPNGAAAHLQPHYNERLLRKSILKAAPKLDAIREQVFDQLAAGRIAVVLTDLGLADYSVESQCLLYSLALALGYPTPSDQKSGQLLWDVRPKPVPIVREATYSEHNREADLHTDSQYFEEPEWLTMLYAVRRAHCSGGVSIFCAHDSILEKIRERRDSDDFLEMLRAPVFSFPLYDPYFASTNWEETGICAPVVKRPILADVPRVRFRKDVIEHGLAIEGASSSKVRKALDDLLEVLRTAKKTSYLLETDCAIIWNNHESLHGRTAFSDSQRHLIRLRIASAPVSDQVALFNAGQAC